MSTSVLGLGQIDVKEKHIPEILDLMVGDKMKVVNRLYGNEDLGDVFEDVEGKDGYITFRMFGKNVLRYSKLERIKQHCKKEIFI